MTIKLACPHCGERAMSAMQKTLLVPGRKRRCSACDKYVGQSSVALRSALIPLWLALGVSFFVLPFALKLYLCAAGGLASIIVQLHTVPLIRRHDPGR